MNPLCVIGFHFQSLQDKLVFVLQRQFNGFIKKKSSAALIISFQLPSPFLLVQSTGVFVRTLHSSLSHTIYRPPRSPVSLTHTHTHTTEKIKNQMTTLVITLCPSKLLNLYFMDIFRHAVASISMVFTFFLFPFSVSI